MWHKLWSALGRLGRTIHQEIWRTGNADRDRAHMATRGDRPFPGCRPCEPGAPDEPFGQRNNPSASPREV